MENQQKSTKINKNLRFLMILGSPGGTGAPPSEILFFCCFSSSVPSQTCFIKVQIFTAGAPQTHLGVPGGGPSPPLQNENQRNPLKNQPTSVICTEKSTKISKNQPDRVPPPRNPLPKTPPGPRDMGSRHEYGIPKYTRIPLPYTPALTPTAQNISPPKQIKQNR